jgi:hypothetical protein
MAEEKLSCEEALAKLRRVHARASPNMGFLEQLTLFHIMNNRLDEDNWEYRNRQVLLRWRKDGVVLADFREPGDGPGPSPQVCSRAAAFRAPSALCVGVEGGGCGGLSPLVGWVAI